MFVDVNVVDGTGGPALLHQDVVVRGDRIVSVAPTGLSHQERVIDGRGKTLLPGFIDAHVHVASSGGPPFGPALTAPQSLERWLAVGVTTVFDLGSSASVIRPLQASIDNGSLQGPRIFRTHLMITGRGSHPIALGDTILPMGTTLAALLYPQVGSVADIDAALATVEETKPDYIKIVVDHMPTTAPIMDRGLLVAAVKAARARGHRVFVHAGDVDDAVAAAEAGCTALAHLPWRGTLTAEHAARLKASGVAVVTTAWMWERTTGLLNGRFAATPEEEWLIPQAFHDEARRPHPHPVLDVLGHELLDHESARAASMQALRQEEVPLVVGTDSVLPGVWPGSSFVAERRALLAAGVKPAELIVAMTSRPARLVAGDDADFGVVGVGKAADLVLVDGDPLTDPTAFDRIELVVHRGRAVEPLRPASLSSTPAASAAWPSPASSSPLLSSPPPPPSPSRSTASPVFPVTERPPA